MNDKSALITNIFSDLHHNHNFPFHPLNTTMAPGTRGVKVDLAAMGLKKYTAVERRATKKDKDDAAAAIKSSKALAIAQKATTSQTRIALLEDERVREQAERQSLRPDLDLLKHQPEPTKKVAASKKSKSKSKSFVPSGSMYLSTITDSFLYQRLNPSMNLLQKLLFRPLQHKVSILKTTAYGQLTVKPRTGIKGSPEPPILLEDALEFPESPEPFVRASSFPSSDVDIPPTSVVDPDSDFADDYDAESAGSFGTNLTPLTSAGKRLTVTASRD